MFTRSFQQDAKFALLRRFLRYVAAYIIVTMVSWSLPVTVYAEGIRVTKEFTRDEAAIASSKFRLQKSLWRLEYKVATTRTVDFSRLSAAPVKPNTPGASLLDEVGRFTHLVTPGAVAAWKSELSTLTAAPGAEPAQARRIAQLHIWIGEYALAHDQQPREAHAQFKSAYDETKGHDSLHGVAAYDCATAVFFTHDFRAGINAYRHLLRMNPPLQGFNRNNVTLMLRHAIGCAGYHAEHARLGIPEPPRLDPLCGAASLAASLRAMGLPYDKATVLKECRVTEEGSNLADIVKAGTKAGVSVRPITANDHALLALPKPLVAFVEHDHFVSVIKADQHGVTYLCSDCGAWPGGAVHLSWKQWHAMAPGVYAAVVRPGYGWDRFFSSLARPHGNIQDVASNHAAQVAAIGPLVGLLVSKTALNVSILAVTDWFFIDCFLVPISVGCCASCPIYSPGSPPTATPPGSSAPPGSPTAPGSPGLPPIGSVPMAMQSGASAGDPVNLATGQEEYQPATDLTVYNPHGPSVQWTRRYDNLRQPDPMYSPYYEAYDFGIGWSHSYNMGVQDPTSNGTGMKYIFEPNGARISFTASAVPSASTTSVQCAVEPGRSLLVTWNYQGIVGNTPAYTYYVITNTDRTKLITTAYNPTTACCQIASLVDRNGNAINFNYTPFTLTSGAASWPLLSSITDASGLPLLTINRANDGSGNITSVDDRYGRSIYYHVGYHGLNHFDGNYFGDQQLDRVSQVVATNTANAPDRYAYGYEQSTIPENDGGSGSYFSESFLHTISVPNPKTSAPGPSVATINYYAYNGPGNPDAGTVSSITDANGNTASFTPIDPNGTLDPSSNLTQVAVSGTGGSYTYRSGFDSNMNQSQLGKQTDLNEIGHTDGAGNNTWTYAYDSANPYSLLTETNGNSNTWTYTYDNSHGAFGNIATIVSPRGVTSTWTWGGYTNFGLGELMSKQDSYVSGGVTVSKSPTTFTWDESHGGLVQSITKPAPGTIGGTQTVTTTYAYNQYGDITQIVSPGNATSSTITIALNYGATPAVKQPLTITDNIGHAITCTYDAQGNYLSMTYQTQSGTGGNEVDFGTATQPGYNLANQRLLVLYPATGESGPGRASMTMAYQYPGGPQTSVKHYDEGNNTSAVRETDYAYGPEGETLSVLGSTETVLHTYDLLYRPLTTTDGNGDTTSYFYNAQGYLYQTAYPGATSTPKVPPTSPLAAGSSDTITNTSYDNAGDVLTRVDGRGVTTTYTYNDKESKLTTIHYALPASPPATLTALADVNLTYDGFGRTSTISNGVTTSATGYTSGGTTYAGYDDQDEPLNIQTSYLAANGTTVLFSKAVSYTYNADSSRASMGTPAGTFTYAYDADQRPSSLTNPFSETASWTYYANNWLQKQTLGNGAYSTYTYDPRGFLTSLVNSASGGGELSNFSNLIHDSVGNLDSSSATVDGQPSGYSGTTSYTYDSADELTQETSARNGSYTNTFGYDGAQNPTKTRNVSGLACNADNQRSNTGYSFDGSGNPTTYGGATLAFDPENRLTKYGTSTMSATYDGTSLRVSKTNSVGTTYYLYDGTLPVCELSSTGTVAATNTFGGGSLLSHHAGSTSTFYTFDAQGNVSERLSSTGAVQTASTFDAFGLSTSTGTASDPFSYCAKWGYYTDAETGLQLATFRYYDPSAGRFLNRDPIGYAGGINVYNYTHNNAVNLQDPKGTCSIALSCDQILAIGLAVIAAIVAVWTAYINGEASIWAAFCATLVEDFPWLAVICFASLAIWLRSQYAAMAVLVASLLAALTAAVDECEDLRKGK